MDVEDAWENQEVQKSQEEFSDDPNLTLDNSQVLAHDQKLHVAM